MGGGRRHDASRDSKSLHAQTKMGDIEGVCLCATLRRMSTPWSSTRIRALRLALGLTTREFGARFCRTSRAVEEWEQGRRVPDPLIVQHFQAIEKQMKIDLDTTPALP